jgi:lysophospholipase L1-like esterase
MRRRAVAGALALLVSAVLPAWDGSGAVALHTEPACDPHPVRAHRAPGPARVLFVGDSITSNVMVDGSGQAFFEQHGFEVRRSATPGFGLLDDPQHGYRDQMALQVAGFDPDVVVLEFIGNYRSFGDPGLPGVDVNTAAFYAAWQAEARAVTAAARARGAEVFWVLGPSVGITAEWRDRVHVLAAGYRRLGAELCDLHYVDAFALLGDPWTPSALRNPDGVHLSSQGGAVLARAIFQQIVATSGAVSLAPFLFG